MAKDNKNIIGRGWSFPPAFDLHSKQVKTVTGKKDIVQSLNLLFGTRPGERLLQQSYGCDINDALFMKIDSSEKAILEDNINRAILNYEPRITVNNLEVDISQTLNGIVYIRIDFIINRENSRQNMVFPFFFQEGTLITK